MPSQRLLVTNLLVLVQLTTFYLTNARGANVPANSSNTPSTGNEDPTNIAFDLPDLTSTIPTASGGEYQIEAYKSINNDRILAVDKPVTNQLIWVSVGQPTLVKTYASDGPECALENKTTSLFHFTTTGFHSYIEMLIPSQRKLLAEVASNKYGINITETQIVNLILSKFECSLVLYDDDNRKYLLKGSVSDFRRFPLRIDFDSSRNSHERKLFTDLLRESKCGELATDMHFMCSMASSGKLMKTNQLVISMEQMQQIGFVDKLFGPVDKQADTVFVTRKQTSELSSEMYSSLNILEDYQMPETQFSDVFVNDLISQVASTQFTMVDVDEVLKSLSAYGFDFRDDLKPDVIKKDLGSIMKVETFGNKSRIVLDKSTHNENESSNKVSGGAGVSFGKFGVNANFARENAKKSVSDTKSLDDQLKELNAESKDEITWEIEGEKVIPKSISVARIQKSSFTKSLSFTRVRLQSFTAAFNRQFGLYTSKSMQPATSTIVELTSRVVALSKTVESLTSTTDSRIKSFHKEFTATKSELLSQTQELTTRSQQLANQGQQTANKVQQLGGTTQQLNTQLTSLSSVAVRRCRVCFLESEGPHSNNQCQQNRNTCSGWSTAPSWTQPFRDDTDQRHGGCTYQWHVECQTH